MKLVQTQKSIEDAVARAPDEDLEVENAFNTYLHYQGMTVHPPVLNGSQIDLLLQKIIQSGKRDSRFFGGVNDYINQLINTSIEAGNDQFVLHTGDLLMNYFLSGIGDSFMRFWIPVRSRITVYGNVGNYFAFGARNVDVTVYGDCCDDVGSHAKYCSFEVHGNIGYDALFRSESTRLITHGSVNGSVAEQAHDFNAEIHGAAGKRCGYRARYGVLTLHGSYGNHLGESAEHCTFKVKKEHYHGDIGLVSRLFRRNKVKFI